MSPAASPPGAATPPAGWARTGWRVTLMVALGLWIYWPALHGGWLWDDRIDVSQNPLMRDPAGWRKIWFAPEGWHFFPLKSMVQWLQWQLWGDRTTGYHATNLALHLLAAILLWRVLARLGVCLAWLGGLLFAVHPLAVESVAWIAELKNTLSLPLLLGALLAWLDYDERRQSGPYLLALGLFVAALLAKTSAVMFPVILLLHAWWKRGRLTKGDGWRTLPFFIASLGLGLVTVSFEHQPATVLLDLPRLDFASRLAGAAGALGFYLSKAIWPSALSPVYPPWSLATPPGWMFLTWFALAGLAVWFWQRRDTWGRAAIFGLGCFALNLLPVLGLVPMAYHHIAWVGDHFAYLSLAGLMGFVVAGAGRLPRQTGVAVAGAVAVLGLAVMAHRYAGAFRDEEALWSYALQQQPDAWYAHHDLAIWLAANGRRAEAAEHYEAALRLNPENSEAWNNLGNIRLAENRGDEAIVCYQHAVALQPRYPQAWANLGNALGRAGRYAEATAAGEKALQIDPGHGPAFATLGDAAARSGRLEEAARYYAGAIARSPDDAVLRNNYGTVLMQAERPAAARSQYEAALRLAPDYAEAKTNLVAALTTLGNEQVRAGQATEAKACYEAALRVQPDDAEVHNNLAFALVQLGRLDEAVRECERALELRPDYAAARENLARLRALAH